MKNNISVKNIVLYAMLISLAVILSYLESLMPINLMIPGIKLGLANLVIIITIYLLGGRAAIFISIARIILAACTFGNMAAFIFAISGAFLSLFSMLIAIKANKFSMLGVSIIGGIMHNVGQILMAVLLLENLLIFSYLPYLMIAGIVSGAIIGILANLVLIRLKAQFNKK